LEEGVPPDLSEKARVPAMLGVVQLRDSGALKSKTCIPAGVAGGDGASGKGSNGGGDGGDGGEGGLPQTVKPPLVTLPSEDQENVDPVASGTPLGPDEPLYRVPPMAR
jgi:hypothetical protein